jgi:hypothetical protein
VLESSFAVCCIFLNLLDCGVLKTAAGEIIGFGAAGRHLIYSKSLH